MSIHFVFKITSNVYVSKVCIKVLTT